jgi:hypothetical protein
MLCHGIENRPERAHAGRQCDLRHLASRAQAFIKPFEDGVVPDCDQQTYVPDCPDVGAPAPGRAGPPGGATVPIAGGDADERREALAA